MDNDQSPSPSKRKRPQSPSKKPRKRSSPFVQFRYFATLIEKMSFFQIRHRIRNPASQQLNHRASDDRRKKEEWSASLASSETDEKATTLIPTVHRRAVRSSPIRAPSPSPPPKHGKFSPLTKSREKVNFFWGGILICILSSRLALDLL